MTLTGDYMNRKLSLTRRVSIATWAGVLVLALGGFTSAGYAHNDAGYLKSGHGRHSSWYPVWWNSFWKHFPGHHATQYSDPVASCGYAVRSGTYSIWPGGYQAWVDVKNVSGETATDFKVLIDIGNSRVIQGYLAEYEKVDDGYMVSAPFWLQWQQIPQGSSYRFQFLGAPYYQGVTPYVISINGVTCDEVAPEISLAASGSFFYSQDTLTLTADATDNVAVRKVVFMQDGEVIGEDSEAPYELDIDVTDALNGNHLYTATAYDPTGNEASAGPARVFVSIGNKFFGTAPSGSEGAPDYADLLTYFNQLTPENASKWGTVESERDVMNWANLDVAYNFARANNIRFKFHTLIWGQQEPGWIADLAPEEQLAEIDEWMSAVAERYPDLEMIDVVNEPLHAPPSYIEALGGAGETGWDWVIKAFEMAREHFPRAQLILNDYQILQLPNFTQDYLNIINLLQERGLIDAIGVQAHFLERTQASMIQANLDTLAETGLPIYASEFDLNLANDAQQANVMRDLFSVFWDHPAVAGVTHWGHLQGDIWRTDAYLIRTDGTLRPAMNWLLCYMSVAGDCDSLVPEYIPAGWHGDEYGVTLEAELYDEGEGLVALGNVVAYTNPGNWIVFRGVEFQDGWNTLWVNYAKGNADGAGANITIHFGSLESDPVETVMLPSTGGWGNAKIIELTDPAWLPRSDTQDVFIRFNDDEEAVANLDYIKIGKPRPVGGNLIQDSSFEGATLESGWGVWYTSGTSLSLTTDQAFSGSQSLLASSRVANSHPSFTLTGLVSAGTAYTVSAEVMHTGAAEDTLRMSAVIACAEGTAPEGHNTYPWIQNISGVAPNTWTKLSGVLDIPAGCDVTEARIYFEGASEGVDLYIDDVEVIPPASNLVQDGGFEGAALAGDWGVWYTSGTSLSLTTDQAFSGSQSLLASGRVANSHPSYNLTSYVSAGTSYAVSAQVMHAGTAEDTLRMSAVIACADGTAPEGHNTYPWIQSLSNIAPNTWTELSGILDVPAGCDVTEARIYFEGTSEGVDLYIDDVSVLAN